MCLLATWWVVIFGLGNGGMVGNGRVAKWGGAVRTPAVAGEVLGEDQARARGFTQSEKQLVHGNIAQCR